jgi:hypothetical protein
MYFDACSLSEADVTTLDLLRKTSSSCIEGYGEVDDDVDDELKSKVLFVDSIFAILLYFPDDKFESKCPFAVIVDDDNNNGRESPVLALNGRVDDNNK